MFCWGKLIIITDAPPFWQVGPGPLCGDVPLCGGSASAGDRGAADGRKGAVKGPTRRPPQGAWEEERPPRIDVETIVLAKEGKAQPKVQLGGHAKEHGRGKDHRG